MCQDKLPLRPICGESEGPKKSAGRLKHGYLVVHGIFPVSTFPLKFPLSAQACPLRSRKRDGDVCIPAAIIERMKFRYLGLAILCDEP